MPLKFALWNMKNVSERSLARLFEDLETHQRHTNLVAYTNFIRSNNVDLLAIIEVTIKTGESAVQQLAASVGQGWGSVTTTDRTYVTRKGEFNSVVFNNASTDGSVHVAGVTEANFPQKASSGTKTTFLNRVPVLFKFALQQPANKVLQVITWHTPQPKHINIDQELRAFAESLQDLAILHTNNPSSALAVDVQQPLLVSADFNYDTAPSSNQFGPWNRNIYACSLGLAIDGYMRNFAGLNNGKPTTLVAKDPATYANHKNAHIPTTFDDLLANAYDNILVNQLHMSGSVATVENHLQTHVAADKLTFTYNPTNCTLEISNARKISDHCAVIASLTL
ncbi:MAG: hypothetical protein QNJ12_16200 [Ilumatobacter sp.]|uniref:hypothetical protein n=1 Tax=Ilumatobacter sp. TaxID=1967498 RepID=UPI0026223408|nr:hypothetical protein [Ilumatobacter sp.]MDJ0770341.1 hypothetical protein [Ilumatobacter sp.]